ncbi:hypothetical protein CEM54_00545 [Salmonella enterica]|nr:hypothetical protein [Salmonella enterica]
MTYKLAFNESALKEWKKLGHTIQEQFKKNFLLDNISVDATCKVMKDINPPLSFIFWIRSQVK